MRSGSSDACLGGSNRRLGDPGIHVGKAGYLGMRYGCIRP
jgi:hypothetical protein